MLVLVLDLGWLVLVEVGLDGGLLGSVVGLAPLEVRVVLRELGRERLHAWRGAGQVKGGQGGAGEAGPGWRGATMISSSAEPPRSRAVTMRRLAGMLNSEMPSKAPPA